MSVVSRFLDPNLVERLNHLQLTARRVVEGATTGQHKSPLRGASIEFRQHRPYVPGDEPRRLDWRVLGRTNRPYIKEYDQETNLRCVLMLDCSGSMAYGRQNGTKFDYACTLAASLSYLMLAQTESVGLAMWNRRLDQWISPHAGTQQLSRIIDTLERASPRQQATADAIHEVADRLERRALVIVISDLMLPVAELRKGLAHLHHDRHEVIVMRVLDHDEIHFPFKNWSRFRGMEGEEPQLCEPALVRKVYLENFKKHQREVEESCRSLGGEFVTLVTDRPLIESLTLFLRKREG